MDPKVILITGANTGIGFEVVRTLYASPSATYNILVGGRDLSKAEAAIRTAEQESSPTGSKLFPIQIDIEHDDSIQRAFEAVEAKFGRLDALVNNAGMSLASPIP